MVDELGKLKADIAALELLEKAIVDKLKTMGAGNYAGKKYDAVVYDMDKSSTDWKELMFDLGFSQGLVDRYTDSKPVTALKVTAKK